MNFLDIFFIAVFVIGLIKGYMKGFIIEIFSFIGFFLGLFAAIELTIPVSNRFFQDSQYFEFMTVGVFVVLFMLVILIMNLIGKALKKVVDFTFLGFFDNILGALASVFKWAFALSVLIWVFDSIGLRLSTDITENSMIYDYVAVVGPKVFELVSEIVPFIKDMMDSLENIREGSKTVYTFL